MPQPLVVMKFGGTSLGSVQRIEHAAELIRRCAAHNRVVVVVSAMSKVTDLLLDTMKLAAAGEESSVEANLTNLREIHLDAARELLTAEVPAASEAGIESLVDGFARTARGMTLLRERPLRSVDEAVTTGERLCALLVSAVLRESDTRLRGRECRRDHRYRRCVRQRVSVDGGDIRESRGTARDSASSRCNADCDRL